MISQFSIILINEALQTYNVMLNNARPSNTVIQIHIMRSDSLDACTCGGLYCSAEPLPMSFILLRTRLVHDHLGSLSWQRRLGPLASLTTWTSLLYVSLTDSLEFQDVTLLESLSDYIHYNTTMKPCQEFHGLTHTISMFLIPDPHVISKHHNHMPILNQPVNSWFISYQAH